MKPPLSALTLCLLLAACSTSVSRPESGIQPPRNWSAHDQAGTQTDRQWWLQFASPELDKLVVQARRGTHELAAAIARVRQARAAAVVAGGPMLPELQGGLNANREKLLRGNGYSELETSADNKAIDYFNASLSASYEIDFWGGKGAARDSARYNLQASEFDQNTVELSLLGSVVDSYVQTLALREQSRIAQLNLVNAMDVLQLVQTRYQAGSATALELAQQKSLVANQQRQVPLAEQRAQEARITLATLLGLPVQQLAVPDTGFAQLRWPIISAGLPSELLTQRPDIAAAEARLAAAQADVQVARAAMLPTVTLTATLGSGANRAPDTLRNPFYTLTAGLVAPIFNNGRLSAERDKASAVQQELLENYRAVIVSAFADVEKALNAINGLDQQRQWQEEELHQAQRAFEISESRYQAGAEDLLTVLETQRNLYQAQDANVQLRLSRLQASVALYKALGGGWEATREPTL